MNRVPTGQHRNSRLTNTTLLIAIIELFMQPRSRGPANHGTVTVWPIIQRFADDGRVVSVHQRPQSY
jgi:hypothetical protein